MLQCSCLVFGRLKPQNQEESGNRFLPPGWFRKKRINHNEYIYTTDDLIRGYRRGISYRKLSFNELVEVSPGRIEELASEYGIKKSNYGITDEEFHSYCRKISLCQIDYWILKREKIDDDSNRCVLFVLLVTIAISVFVFMISVYFAAIFIIIIGWLVYKFLYPPFNESYCNNLINDFLTERKITRNYKVEEYINEVMFQAYARNKNAQSNV